MLPPSMEKTRPTSQMFELIINTAFQLDINQTEKIQE